MNILINQVDLYTFWSGEVVMRLVLLCYEQTAPKAIDHTKISRTCYFILNKTRLKQMSSRALVDKTDFKVS